MQSMRRNYVSQEQKMREDDELRWRWWGSTLSLISIIIMSTIFSPLRFWTLPTIIAPFEKSSDPEVVTPCTHHDWLQWFHRRDTRSLLLNLPKKRGERMRVGGMEVIKIIMMVIRWRCQRDISWSTGVSQSVTSCLVHLLYTPQRHSWVVMGHERHERHEKTDIIMIKILLMMMFCVGDLSNIHIIMRMTTKTGGKTSIQKSKESNAHHVYSSRSGNLLLWQFYYSFLWWGKSGVASLITFLHMMRVTS